MISYSIKQILTLVPEAFPLLKQAHYEEDYPLSNKSDAIASALRVAYETDILGKSVDIDIMEKVAMAVEVYDLGEVVSRISAEMVSEHNGRMEKSASIAVAPEAYLEKQAQMEAGLCGYKDIQGLVKQAEVLLEEARTLGQEPADHVLRYSCDAWMDKEAAINGLHQRYALTKNDMFVKLAAALGMEESLVPSGPLVKNFCETITGMDKLAGLDWKGFDIYKECLLTKTAAAKSVKVKVGKQEYPIERIMRIPKHHLSNYLGADVASSLSDPHTAKAVIESLPADMHSVLNSVIKSC
jgi:hypothetical protein